MKQSIMTQFVCVDLLGIYCFFQMVLLSLLFNSKGDSAFVSDINLSLSQKQRISLARCIVHDPDLILIEDCFR